MPESGTVTWRRLWALTTQDVGSRAQARWLCETASGVDGDEFLGELDERVTQRCIAHLDAMLARLATGEPLQYVLGRWGFRRLDLMVDRRVLIPRPETELVAEAALDVARSMPRPIVLADLGTGSGAIGLSLAAELPREGVTVWLTDVSTDALDVARANLAGIGRLGANVRFGHGSWYDALPAELAGRMSVIVANPPYIAPNDPDVEPIVRDWEPPVALFAADGGLAAARTIIAGAREWLAPGGWLVLEIGAGQGAAIATLLADGGLAAVEVRRDLSGHDRITLGRRPA